MNDYWRAHQPILGMPIEARKQLKEASYDTVVTYLSREKQRYEDRQATVSIYSRDRERIMRRTLATHKIRPSGKQDTRAINYFLHSADTVQRVTFKPLKPNPINSQQKSSSNNNKG